jgi:hypothetical protein
MRLRCSTCSLTIIGEEDEVIAVAAQHAAAAQGHQDSPELREQLRAMLEPEDSYIPGTRATEPFPALDGAEAVADRQRGRAGSRLVAGPSMVNRRAGRRRAERGAKESGAALAPR